MQKEYEFICELWKFVKCHRLYNSITWADADDLLKRYPEVPYAPEMVKAYLDNISNEVR